MFKVTEKRSNVYIIVQEEKKTMLVFQPFLKEKKDLCSKMTIKSSDYNKDDNDTKE